MTSQKGIFNPAPQMTCSVLQECYSAPAIWSVEGIC